MIRLTIPGHNLPSWNQLYAGRFWAYRKGQADLWHNLVYEAWLEAGKPTLPHPGHSVNITVTGYYKNKRVFHDADNQCIKLAIDGLKGRVIEDDDWRHVRAVTSCGFLDSENPRTEILISYV